MNNYPSLDTCKQIADLFDETEIKVWWLEYFCGEPALVIEKDITLPATRYTKAPSIAELLDRLPYQLKTRYLTIHKFKQDYCVCYKRGKANPLETHVIKHESLPEALGLLLKRLDEEGLLNEKTK